MTDKLTPKQADVGCKYHLHPMQYSAWVEKMGIDWAERFCVEIKPTPSDVTVVKLTKEATEALRGAE